jgi:hypothetical protein
MAIKRPQNIFKAYYWHLHGGKGFATGYFWTLLNGGRSYRPSVGIWDVNHPDWDRRSPLAYNRGYEEFNED